MTTPTDVSDTSDEALTVQLECLRQMSPQEPLRRACAWSGQVRRMAFDAIRRRHPEFSEDEFRLRFIELTYGKELADEVRNWQREQRQ
ncbi:MAG: hypothetical protein Fues2KO_00050 [Fuerstiella sp.]